MTRNEEKLMKYELATKYVKQNFENLEDWSDTVVRAILDERERCKNELEAAHKRGYEDGRIYEDVRRLKAAGLM